MDDPRCIAGASLLALGAFYYFRTQRLSGLRAHARGAKKDGPRDTYSSKFPFTNMKLRMSDPTVWKVNEPGFAREGLYGLERRDYIDPWGTHVQTHTDAFVNV